MNNFSVKAPDEVISFANEVLERFPGATKSEKLSEMLKFTDKTLQHENEPANDRFGSKLQLIKQALDTVMVECNGLASSADLLINAENSENQKQSAEMRTLNEDLQTRCRKLEGEKKDIAERNEVLKAEVSGLKENVAALEQQVATLTSILQSVKPTESLIALYEKMMADFEVISSIKQDQTVEKE